MKNYKAGFSIFYIASILLVIYIMGTAHANNKNTFPKLINSTELDSVLVKSETIYNEYCSGCHGEFMEDFVDREWKFGDSDEEIFKSIAEGRASDEMPAFNSLLSQQEVKDLIVKIRHKTSNIDENDLKRESEDFEIYKSSDFNFRLEEVVNDLESPWGMVFLTNGDLLVTDKSGELWRVKKDKSKIEIEGVPNVLYKGQGGLLDIELHPNFSENSWLYLSYSISKREAGQRLSSTAVSRYKLQGNSLVDGKLIFEALPYSNRRHHYGSRLEFDDEGYLYITVGDRGEREVNPQNLSLYPGKVHRVFENGRIPEDNPFVNKPGVVKSVFSYGHRNAQGMIKNPITGEIWTHEHGPKGGDEINIIKKGANYGWPVVSFGINYDGTIFTNLTAKEGMEQPLHYWTPSIAPSGMDFVRGKIYPGWEGHLLVGSLRFEYLKLCKIDGKKVVSEEILLEDIGRVRNVKQGPDGYLYVAVEDPGTIYKIIPLK